MAATPALSSAPSTLEPSEYTASAFTTGVISGVGNTVSMCAFSMIGGESLPFAGQWQIRFPIWSRRQTTPAASNRGWMIATTRSSFPQ